MQKTNFIQRLWQGCIHINYYIKFNKRILRQKCTNEHLTGGKKSPVHDFIFYSHEQNSSSPVCLAAPCDILGVGRMAAFIVYFELAGTSMLSGARPDFDGGVFPAAILFRL